MQFSGLYKKNPAGDLVISDRNTCCPRGYSLSGGIARGCCLLQNYLLISLSISVTAASSCLSSPRRTDAGSLYTSMSGSIW